MSAATESGLPSLLVQAAHSAAAADGLAAPKTAEKVTPKDSSAAAAAALTSIASTQKKEGAASVSAPALNRTPPSIAAAHGPARTKPDSAPSAGSAAHMTPPSIAAAHGPARSKPDSAPSAGSAAHMMAAAAAAPSTAASMRKSPAAPSSQTASPMPSSSSSKKKGPPLRRGKWTPEEEAYANRLILEFKAGLLPLTDGTTLRTFLSKLLNCDPMRISKKFVGSNCIGKQVFRRRTADINRLTPEQIQQSRAELSELERRFLERVAQTNRVKSSGVGGSGGGGSGPGVVAGSAGVGKSKGDEMGDNSPPSPPWLQPPSGYKQGTGAAMAAAALGSNRAAAAGRALLQGGVNKADGKSSKHSLASHGSAGLLAMAELQRRSQQNLLQNAMARSSANNLLAAAAAGGGAGGSGLSGSAMAQIARNASAARLAGLTAAGNSVNNLMLKTGLSREQLTQLAREQGMSSAASLSNMMERQSSFDALMSLDFQSLQSIDNLANLIQTGGPGQVPETGMKNWSADSQSSLAAAAAAAAGSAGNLSGLASARRLASQGRMESLLRSLSSGNVDKSSSVPSGESANATFSDLLQSMQGNLNSLGAPGNSANNLFGAGNAASALSLANMLRADSSTGLTALRMQDGLVQRNTSVDDFLSLVASGDIPHQDPKLLNVPLMHQQQQAASQAQSGAHAAATYLAQQQLLAQAARAGSFGNLRNSSAASLLSQSASNTALQQQARAAQLELLKQNEKRKLIDVSGETEGQGPAKR